MPLTGPIPRFVSKSPQRMLLVLVHVVLACACASLARASDAEIPVTTAGEGVPIVQPVPENPPSKTPLHSNDPLLSIVDRLHETKKDDAESADVVELGDGPDVLPTLTTGKWDVASEEAAPPGVTRDAETPAPHHTANDPEFVRAPLADDGEPVEEPHAAKAKTFSPAPNDPEVPWRLLPVPHDEPDESVAEAPHVHGERAAVTLDRPRFRSGEGLDSNAAEIVSEMALRARQKEEAAKAEGSPDAPVSALERAQQEVAAAENKPAAPVAPPTDGEKPGAKKKNEKNDKNGKKGEKKLDPEQEYNELIKKIDEDKPRQEKLMEAARKEADERMSKFGDFRKRDERAAMVLDVLSRKAELSRLSGRIIDAFTKLPVCARVRLTDMTDLSVDAVLPEGFWTTGEFTAQPLTGLSKIEITRGRFRPTYVERVETKKAVITPFEKAVACPPGYDFAAKGWYLADLNLGVQCQRRESPVWLGAKPALVDLVRMAQAENVQIVGVPAPWGDGNDANDPAVLKSFPNANVLLLPVFRGPEHPFHGTAMGLGMRTSKGLPSELSDPEIPLRETFEEIRARGGLSVYSNLGGTRVANIRSEIFPLFPRLEASNYFGTNDGLAHLYAANELPFDTVAGPAYDLLEFDGSEQAERLWYNLLDHGYSVSIIGAGGGSIQGGRIPFGQTLIKLPSKPTIPNVLDAIKAGRTVVSFGPAVFCKIAERDMGPGSILPADGRALTLQVQAFASLARDMQLDKIEVIRNGVIVHTHSANDGETEIHQMSLPVRETSSAWYVVRVTERTTKREPDQKVTTAWTSPIFFRGAAYSPPAPARSKISGVLRIGQTPVAGTVKAVVPGQPDKTVATDANGRFTIELASAGTLIFEAPHAEPLAKRVFEHPKVQRAIGALQSDRDGKLSAQFARPALFGAWSLLLSELDWDVSLQPKD